jgi:uncharacterized protein with ATP-grasp and redox domains
VKPTPDCIPCILRQVLNTARKIADDPWLHRKVLNEVMQHLQRADFDRSPAELVTEAERIAGRALGSTNPFAEDKLAHLATARALEAKLRESIARAQDPLYAAVKVAVAGNAFDSHILQNTDLQAAIERVFELGLAIDDFLDFKVDLERAGSVLYLLDSAGEALLDRLLVERLIERKKLVTCVARKAPVLNDATREDAEAAGLAALVPVIDAGTDVMGVPLALASADFRARFEQADLVIAKGAANYETLEGGRKSSYFLLTAKCPVVARHFGVAIGDSIFIKQ